MKFKHLDKAQVAPGATARFEFDEIAPFQPEGQDESGSPLPPVVPWLEVRPAGESNRAFTAAVLARPDKLAITRDRLSVEDLALERQRSVPLWAEHVLTGNGGGWVDDETGQPVPMPLSVEHRRNLLRQLPPDQFDRLRVFCNQLRNFRG